MNIHIQLCDYCAYSNKHKYFKNNKKFALNIDKILQLIKSIKTIPYY